MEYQAMGTAIRKAISDQFQEIHGKKPDDTAQGCAQYFSNTDFFGALFRGKHHQSQQTQTGDQDGQ